MQATSRLALTLLLAAPILPAQPPATSAIPDYAKQRAERARDLTEPFGWFSLIALEWLKPGLTTVGSAPGNTLVLPGAPAHLLTLEQQNGIVTVRAADPSVLLAGKPVPTGAVLPTDEKDASALASGAIRLWAIHRNGKSLLRVKDANAPARLYFHGLRWYAPDPRLRVTARWIPYTTPHTLTTHNQIGQVSTATVPGYVEFNLHGSRETLVPTYSGKDSLFFVLRDATYLKDTDGGGRFLSTDPPSNGLSQPGTVILDFNQAANPPCAYTPYATCPLASPENRLPIPIPAGEKRYTDDARSQHRTQLPPSEGRPHRSTKPHLGPHAAGPPQSAGATTP